MQAYWNPVCPACSQRVWSEAFPGDDGGPVDPQRHRGRSDVVCCNLECRTAVPIHAGTVWRRQGFWNHDAGAAPPGAPWPPPTHAPSAGPARDNGIFSY